MPTLSVDVVRRYGFALLSVGLAVVSSLLVAEVFGDRHPFFLFLVAVAIAAGYGGYGPSLLALALSWLSVDSILLLSPAHPPSFESNPHDAFASFTVGAAITVLGGALRAARERAKVTSFELRQAFESHQAEREWYQISLASICRCRDHDRSRRTGDLPESRRLSSHRMEFGSGD